MARDLVKDVQRNIDACIGARGVKHVGKRARHMLSQTEQTMVADWTDGQIPAVKVSKYCRAFSADSTGDFHPSVKEIAAMGAGATGQQHRGNINRALKRQYAAMGRTSVPLFEIDDVPVLLWDPNLHRNTDKYSLPFVAPHKYYYWLFHSFPDKFYYHVCGGGEDCNRMETFWAGCRSDDTLVRDHPVLRSCDNLNMIIPGTTHGDGVPVAKQGAKSGSSSMVVVSKSSILAQGKTCDKQILSFVCPSTILLPETLEPMWRRLWHSSNALAAGKFPMLDDHGRSFTRGSFDYLMRGQDIADGLKWAELCSIGDLEWHANYKGLRHFSCNCPCFCCNANSVAGDSMAWSCFAKNAKWKKTIHTNANWVPDEHHWYNEIHGVRLQTHCFDPAHCLDKGVAGHIAGSVLHDLVYECSILPDDSIKENLAEINTQLRDWYKTNNIKDGVSSLTLKHFTNPAKPWKDYPYFYPGNMSKVRTIVGFIHQLAAQYCDGSRRDLHRERCCRCLRDIYDIIYSAGWHLTKDEHRRLVQAGDGLANHLSFLHMEAGKHGLHKYNVTVKVHCILHMTYNSKFLNPMAGATLDGEDFVGKVQQIASSCTRGTSQLKLGHKTIEKWRCRQVLAMNANIVCPIAGV